MATIVNTLIDGLTSQMVQARLNSVDAKPFLFGTHFPVKKVNGFVWRTLGNQLAKKNVAADLHTDNGTVLRKRRPLFESAKGDIPFISISRPVLKSRTIRPPVRSLRTAMQSLSLTIGVETLTSVSQAFSLNWSSSLGSSLQMRAFCASQRQQTPPMPTSLTLTTMWTMI